MTKLVGILNVTPDSFAEAAPSADAALAIERAATLIADGADVLDVGAESTRPGAVALDADQEWARLAPCLAKIVEHAHNAGVAVSVDTRHAATAARALGAGVDWINAVDGVSDAMAAVVAPSPCRLVVMHAVSVPVVRGQTLPPDIDVIAHLRAYFADRLDALERAGIARERVILDPGVGFGTTPRQALTILHAWPDLAALGCPMFIGHSRKSFQTLFTDAPAAERDDVTLALSGMLFTSGLDFLRVHDVARHAALRSALKG